jgi:chromosome segregation ATPase
VERTRHYTDETVERRPGSALNRSSGRLSDRVNLEQTQRQAEQLRDEADRLRAQIREAYAKAEDKDAKIQELQESFAAATTALAQNQQDGAAADRQLRDAKADVERLEAETARANAVAKDGRMAAAAAAEQIRGLEQDVQGLNGDLDKLRKTERGQSAATDVARRAAEFAETSIAQLREQINQERRQHAEALSAVNEENGRLESELRQCVADLERRNSDHDTLVGESDANARRLAETEKQHAAVARELAEETAKVANLEAQLAQHEDVASTAREEAQGHEDELLRLRDKNDQLIRLLAEQEELNSNRSPSALETELDVAREELGCMEAEIRRLQLLCTQQQRELIAHEARARDFGTDVAMWHAHANESRVERDHADRDVDFAHQDISELTARLRSRLDEARSQARSTSRMMRRSSRDRENADSDADNASTGGDDGQDSA